MKFTSILAASFIVGAGAIMTVQPDSSVSLWIQERDTVSNVEGNIPTAQVEELVSKPVRHIARRHYGAVILDVEPATGPPEMDDYPIGPPNSSKLAKKNFGLVGK